MFSDRSRRRADQRVRPGDGSPLQRFRWWQPLSRSLFHLELTTADGRPETWSVDIRHGGDDNGTVRAKLYLDGRLHAVSKLPARFPVTGGVIEVVTSGFGLRRCHYVSDDGAERQLAPDVASAEGRRARLENAHPVAGRLIGLVSVVVLLIGLVLGVPQIIEEVSQFPPLAERIGSTFTSPIQLPAWLNLSILAATLVASTERALRLRYNWLLDGGLFDGDG
ncbi:hypothetical protein [Promicromonospora sukumoe]|uniref:hypothetical protein n=1 Tax=Promicromonospora sukumoe TaxID=88382 RepID=UPI00037F05DA|nr:hypothetical protein [Promicromonospora sukumoe]